MMRRNWCDIQLIRGLRLGAIWVAKPQAVDVRLMRNRLGGVRRRLLTFLVLTVVLVALLPLLVAKTPLRTALLSIAAGGTDVRVTVGEAALGWFSGPSLSHVEVKDASGNLLLSAEKITLDRAPAYLLIASRELGTIDVVRPTLHLVIRPDGSNLEDVAGRLLAKFAADRAPDPGADAASARTTYNVRIVEGTILAEDIAMNRRWRVEGIDLQYDTHGVHGGLARGKLAAQILNVSATEAVIPAPGRIAVSLDPDNGRQLLSWQAARIDLALAEPWLQRSLTAAELSGRLTCDGAATWTASAASMPADLTTTGSLLVEQLDASAAALNGDHVKLARIEAPWRLVSQPAGLKIEDLQLRSDVGRFAVRGTIDSAVLAQSPAASAAWNSAARHDIELRGQIDLARLAAMLPRALRLRDDTTITSGTVDIAARCRPSDEGQLITGSLSTTQLAGTTTGRRVQWDQPVDANLAIERANGATRLDSLTCHSDFLQVTAAGTKQRFSAKANVDLSRLAQQLGQFVDLRDLELAGAGEAELTWAESVGDQLVSPPAAGPSQLRAAVTDLRLKGLGWNIHEPRVELSGDARWNGATGELTTESAQLVTSTVSLLAKNVRYRGGQAAQPAKNARVSGTAAFRADLARLATWRAVASGEPHYVPHGELTGNLRFAEQQDSIAGELSVRGEKLALTQKVESNGGELVPGYQVIWQEPQLSIRGLAAYEPSSDRLNLNQLQIQSNALQVSASGEIRNVTSAGDANLSGTASYDLAAITPLLRPYLGSGIQLTGREQARFDLAGQLNSTAGVAVQPVGFSPSAIRVPSSEIHWSRRIRAQLELPWSGANVYGLPIGGGRVAAVLGDGAIRIEPLSLAVGEGRFTASPQVRLDPPPAEVTLPAGPIVTNVRISPEVSEAMLKYVAPVLAGTTQSEGLFSLALDGARVPLGEPQRADSAGKLTVHSVRVVPGPIAMQWIGLAQQIEAVAKRRDPGRAANRSQVTLLSVRDQQVNFRVMDGRVHHQYMEFQVGEVTMRSRGSVGFDETISLTLEVPVQDAWVAKEPLLAGFKGQSLQVPISGTLTRPQMDQRAIASVTQQLLQGAAQQAIGGELNKALDKLFKSR
jgi:hypothetical protein